MSRNRLPRSIVVACAVSVTPRLMVATWAIAVVFLVSWSARPAAAQAAAEYGHLATGSSTALNALSKKLDPTLAPPKTSAPNMIVVPDTHSAVEPPSDKSIAAANLRVFQRNAGENAAKLSLKSAPANAVVRIDGKPVGETPLLMSLAPGTYRVEMEGPRMEFGKQQLTVGAKEAREIDLHLSAAPRYPTHIRLQ